MRCKECGYRLWNLPSRTCPECGTGFAPSHFEFTPNSVQFCCPHCGSAYYGTTEKGHLQPIEFSCTGCGRDVHMDQMILLPTSGIEEERTQVDQIPWLQRKDRGFFRSWFATIGMALVQPARLMRALPDSQQSGSAWWFALVTNPPSMLLGLGLIVALPMIFGMTAGAGMGPMGILVGLAMPIAIIGVITMVLTLIVIAIWGLVTHVLLRGTGSTHGPLRQTYTALCFSTGANVGTAIPCLGFYVGWIWWLVSAVIMVKVAQRVSGWRAALAVLTFPACAILLTAGSYGWLMYSAFTGTGGWTSAAAQTKTDIVAGGILAYAQNNAGQVPQHAYELLADALIQENDLIVSNPDTQTTTTGAGVQIVTRGASPPPLMPSGPPDEVVKAAIASLPANSVAHRVGDFVFVHNGINVRNCNGLLWIVVQAFESTGQSPSTSARDLIIGYCDGTTERVDDEDFSAALTSQNELRTVRSLLPIPDPRTLPPLP